MNEEQPRPYTWDEIDPAGWYRVVIVLTALITVAFCVDVACGYVACPGWVRLGP